MARDITAETRESPQEAVGRELDALLDRVVPGATEAERAAVASACERARWAAIEREGRAQVEQDWPAWAPRVGAAA